MAASILYLENFQRLANITGDIGPLYVNTTPALWGTDVEFTAVNGKRWMYFTSLLQYYARAGIAVSAKQTIGVRVLPRGTSINLWGNGISTIVGQEFYVELSLDRVSSTVVNAWYRIDGGPWLTAGSAPFSTDNRIILNPFRSSSQDCAITDIYLISGGMDDALGPINVTDVAVEVMTNTNWDVTNLTQVLTGDRGNVAKINSKDLPGNLKLKLKSLDQSTVGQRLVGMSVNLEPSWVPGYPGLIRTSLDRVSGGVIASISGVGTPRTAVNRHIGVTFADENADLKTPQTLLDELTMSFTAVAP